MYDGIQEFDNPMPRWWVMIFWGTAFFAIGYFAWFNVYFKGTPATEEYAQEMTAAREDMAKKALGTKMTEEALATLSKNPAMMADAQNIFKKRCVQCHNSDGQGLIGPNLTDDYWIHGSATLMDIYGVVNGGVPSKGMPEWGKQLAPIEVAKIAAYVGTLRGKHVTGKAPEGTLLASVAPASK
jgi:cytochrome c oxidase cbb3-type subunit 3